MKDIAASVRDRLQKFARETRTDFQLLLIRYFQERMLYRLSESGFKHYSFFLFLISSTRC